MGDVGASLQGAGSSISDGDDGAGAGAGPGAGAGASAYGVGGAGASAAGTSVSSVKAAMLRAFCIPAARSIAPIGRALSARGHGWLCCLVLAKLCSGATVLSADKQQSLSAFDELFESRIPLQRTAFGVAEERRIGGAAKMKMAQALGAGTGRLPVPRGF